MFEHLLNTRFELSKPIKLFKKSLFEILEIQGQLSKANGVARADRFVALPTSDSIALQCQKFLDESFLRRAVLLGMDTDGELFLLDFPGLNEGFEMNAALVVVVPIICIN